MDNKELIVRFTWPKNVVGTTAELSGIIEAWTESLAKTIGTPLDSVTFTFQGKTLNVPIKAVV